MKEYHFGDGKFAQFIAGKGFYVALAVCLVGAAAAAWLTVDKTLESLTGQEEVPVSDVSESGYGFSGDADEIADSSPFSSRPESSARTVEKEPDQPVAVEKDDEHESSGDEHASQSVAPADDDAFWPFTQDTVYAMPVIGDIIQGFSGGELVKNETLGEWRTHDGIDIKCDVGTDVCAPADGKVTRVWSDPMWGQCVEIEHGDGVVSTLCGLQNDVPVKEGDEVKLGAVLGKLGESNSAEIGADSHLHFAMKKDGKFADPLEIMDMK